MKGPPLQKQPLLQVQPASPPMWSNGRSDNSVVLGAVGGVFIGLIALTLISRWMIRICRPNEMLVVTGSHSNQGQQGVKGYRVVANGGWTFVKPILETARRIDVTLLPVVVEVNNAYSHGGTPLNIQAIANVKISSDPEVRNNAIERFLGRNLQEISTVAQQTLEGALREVVATLTPEQVNARIAALKNRDAKATVIVQADKEVAHGRVVTVLDAAKQAGLKSVAIATRGQ